MGVPAFSSTSYSPLHSTLAFSRQGAIADRHVMRYTSLPGSDGSRTARAPREHAANRVAASSSRIRRATPARSGKLPGGRAQQQAGIGTIVICLGMAAAEPPLRKQQHADQ